MMKQLPVWEQLTKVIIWKQIGALKGKTILDFESGTWNIAEHFAIEINVITIEQSKEMLANQVNTNGYQ